MRSLPTIQAACLLACCTLTAGDFSLLRQLGDNCRFFELRRALQQPGWDDSETLFYRAQIACRFGQEADGVELLRRFLRTDPDSRSAREASEQMAAALLRIGRYREAVEAFDAAFRLTPPKDRDENSRNLIASLIDVPPMSLETGQEPPVKARRNLGGGWNVPVDFDGSPGELDFDTGANFSLISESEAARLGLTIRDSTAYVNGGTGGRTHTRLAVAPNLRIGPAHLHNVVFLVVPDKALYVPPLHASMPGFLGIPAIRALRHAGIASDGTMRLGPLTAGSQQTPNLFFDAQQLIVELSHQRRPLQLFLDTGANSSGLFPSVRQTLTPQEAAAMTTTQQKTVSVGGKIVKQKIGQLPLFQLLVLDTPLDLRNASFLPGRADADPRYRDGILGIDALFGGFDLDFQNMRFTVNSPD
jgi:hypothetical protein